MLVNKDIWYLLVLHCSVQKILHTKCIGTREQLNNELPSSRQYKSIVSTYRELHYDGRAEFTAP